MPQFENKTPEEIRYEDYAQGIRTPRAPTSGGYGASTTFGAPNPSTGLFGSSPAPAMGFGAPTPGGLFGSPSPAPAPYGAGGFGAAPSTGGGLFGGAAGGFGAAPAPTGGLFGSGAAPAPAAGFGTFGPAPAPIGGGLFGSTNPAPAPFGSTAFGSTPAPSTGFGGFGAPAPATGFGGFGSPAPSGGLFGNTNPAPAPFGSTAPAPFGLAPPPSAGFGGFGAPAPSTGFGGFGSSQAPSGGLFGAPAPSGYGAPVGGGLFGGAQATPPSMYGIPQQPLQQQLLGAQPQPLFAPNAQIIPPAGNEILAQRMRALQNQQRELEKTDVWRGSPSRTATTPTSNYDMAGSPFFGSPPGRLSSVMPVYTPRSGAMIRPRGFPKSESSSKASQFLLARRDNRALMSPEASLQSSQLKLVINPDSLRKSRKFGGLNLDIVEATSPDQLGYSNEAIDQPPSSDDNEADESAGVAPPTSRQHTPSPLSRGQNTSPSLYEPPTSTSPGFDYYQQVIGDIAPTGTIPRRTPARTPVAAEQSVVPMLTKEGYQVTPSLEELAAMSEADLASVLRFSVSRPGYGKVEWEGAVDVRGADLDRIVIIDSKDVSVYEKDEAEDTKPDEGSKLNRPAKITFYQVFHKKGTEASTEEKEAFATKIEKTTRKIGAEFISYNAETGVWCIKVQHFSRYRFQDDESDDDNSAAEAVSESTKPTVGFLQLPKQTPRQQHPSLATKRKATPFRATRIVWDDQDLSQTSGYDESEFAWVSGTDDDAMEAESVAQSIIMEATQTPMESTRLTPKLGSGHWATEGPKIDEGDDSEDDESFTYNVTLPTPEELLYASYGKPSLCDRLASKANAAHSQVELGGCIGRSFRVGWLPNGSFVKLDHVAVSGMLVVGRPRLSANENHSAILPLLKAQRAHSRTCSHQDGCPLFALCGDDRDATSTVPSKNVATALESLSCTECGNENAINVFALLSNHVKTDEHSPSEFSTPLEARQMTAASHLLVEMSSLHAKLSTKTQSDVLVAVFSALSVGDTGLACEIALNGGLEALGVALASGTSAKNSLMLLIDVASSEELSRIIFPLSLRILNSAAGAVIYEDNLFRTGDQSLDWQQRLEMRIFRETNKTLSQTLQKYESDINSGVVPYPKPSYPADQSSMAESLFYRMLKFCANFKSISVCEAVNPSGWTPFLSDFSLSFHLIAAICAAKLDYSSSLSELEVQTILDGFGAQLAQLGLWEYAVFVNLSQIGPSSRTTQRLKVQQAKSLVLRHFNGKDANSDVRRDFLERTLGIPSNWFEEALCYRAANIGDSFACIYHALEFDEEFGRLMFSETLLPNFFFEVEGKDRLALLEQVSGGKTSESTALAVYLFVILEDRVIEFAHGEHIPDKEELEDLRANASLIQKVMRTALVDGEDSNVSLLCPVPKKKVSVSSLAHEILIRMRDINTHLESISCFGMEEK